MSKNDDAVNVLEVMDELIDMPAIECPDDQLFVDRAKEARAAVAELIAADREFDAAYAEFPPIGYTKREIDGAAARINAARARRAAAIARIGGAA